MKVYLWFKATSPYAHNVWDVKNEAELLDDEKADLLNLLKSILLYSTKRTRSDIEPAVELLTTRFAKSNVVDWNKLRRSISYLDKTEDNVRIIGVFNIT